MAMKTLSRDSDRNRTWRSSSYLSDARAFSKSSATTLAATPSQKFFLLVDEINRGDIPRIFGELLTLLEKDKRGLQVTLPLSGDNFAVPANVHVLGTMNTADRSIALLDTALRRRFGFVELMPDIAVLGTTSAGGSIPLGPWLAALNDRLREHLGRDARNLQIGHAYLLDGGRPVTDFTHFVRVLAEESCRCWKNTATKTMAHWRGFWVPVLWMKHGNASAKSYSSKTNGQNWCRRYWNLRRKS